MTNKAETLGRECFEDYERGFQAGVQFRGKPVALNADPPKHPEWYDRGFREGQTGWRAAVEKVVHDLAHLDMHGDDVQKSAPVEDA